MKTIFEDLWDNVKWASLCLLYILEGEEKKNRIENIFEEIMSESFPNLKETDIRIHEAQRAPNKLKPNKTTPRHIVIKMAKVKDKERILKATRGVPIMAQGLTNPTRNHEVVGSVPALAQWVNDPALP